MSTTFTNTRRADLTTAELSELLELVEWLLAHAGPARR